MSHGESISFEKMDGGGPELSRMIQELEGSNNPTEESDHHEQKSGTNSAFCKEVLNYTIFISRTLQPGPRSSRKPGGDPNQGNRG